LARIEFAVVVELIPCSVAQGIQVTHLSKSLDLQMFSRRIFTGKRLIPRNSLLIPCYGLPVRLLRRNLNVGLKHLFRAVG